MRPDRASNRTNFLSRGTAYSTEALASVVPEALRCFDLLPDSAHVRQPVVKVLYGCSDATVWRRVKDGGIPKPHKLSARVTAWNVGDLRRDLAKRTS
jgi:predicted DNA-binding transcriptional regulator AlpA